MICEGLGVIRSTARHVRVVNLTAVIFVFYLNKGNTTSL